MKSPSALILATALALAAPAFAQTQTAPVQPAPGAAETLPSEQPAGPSAEVVAAHQAMLTKTIADLQAGKPDYASMHPQLAEAVRQQEAAVLPVLQGVGEVKSIAYEGPVQNALKFKVVFAQRETTWILALAPDGKLAGMVFR